MNFEINQLHPLFFGEVVGLDLARDLDPSTIEAVQAGIDRLGVLVFRGQTLDDEDQIRFSHRFGQPMRSITVHREDQVRRLRRDELSDISNLDEHGMRMDRHHPKRLLAMSTQIWHTDNSFRKPSGKYTFLCAKQLPPEGGNTEFADMRAAWDALPPDRQHALEPLRVMHSLSYSRVLVGSPDLDETERQHYPPVEQGLVRVHPGSGRKSLFLASHAAWVVDMPRDQGRALLDDLMAFATQPRFVHAHVWRPGDFLMWDNRCTMHRARPFDEDRYKRELRRTTVAEEMDTTSPGA